MPRMSPTCHSAASHLSIHRFLSRFRSNTQNPGQTQKGAFLVTTNVIRLNTILYLQNLDASTVKK